MENTAETSSRTLPGAQTRWKPYWDATRWPVADWGEGWTDAFHIWVGVERGADDHPLGRAVLNEASSPPLNGSAMRGPESFSQPHRLLLNLALGGGPVEASRPCKPWTRTW